MMHSRKKENPLLKRLFTASILCASFALAGCGSTDSSGEFNPPPKIPGKASYFDSEFLVVNCEQDIPQFTLSSMDSKPSPSTTKELCSCIAEEARLDKSGKTASQLMLPGAVDLCVDKFKL